MSSDTDSGAGRLIELASRAGRRLVELARLLAEPPGVYGAIGMLLVGLFATTTVVVARFEHARAARADGLFAEGERAIAGEHIAEGIIALRAALALDRRNPDYGLALASALLQAGRSREAASYLDAVLAARPTGGPANLARARTVRMLGDVEDAALYYRRAADGTWPPERAGERIGARFEMAEYLLGRSRLPEAGIALTELRVAAPDDQPTRLRLARLLLMARLPEDAAGELRALTGKAPADADAWGLLARAEFERGNDAAARSAGRRALQIRPDDASTGQIVDVATGTLSRDPSLPRLRNADRVQRARQLLVEVVDGSSACIVGQELVPDVLARQRRQARDFLRSGAARDADPVEDAIQLAEGLWLTTVSVCPDTPGTFPILDRLLTRLLTARQEGS